MKPRCSYIPAAAAALLFAGMLSAQSVVVILNGNNGGWSVETALKLTINGKNKIRLPDASGDLTADVYKRAAAQPIGDVPLRAHRGGYLVSRSGDNWLPAVPDGAGFKGASTLQALWSSARIELHKEKGQPGPEVSPAMIFAVLPGDDPNGAVAAFLADDRNFKGVGEKNSDEAFSERMSLLIAIAKTNPDSPQLKQMLLSAMNTAIQSAGGGIVKFSDIQQGLKFADVSAQAFPSDPDQKRARDELTRKKDWIDRQLAILRALHAGEQYDFFIDKYGDFEFYDNSFPEMRKLRDQAIAKSVSLHDEEAERLVRLKQYIPAMREYRLALTRNPGDRAMQEALEQVRLDEVNEHARLVKRKPVDTTSPEYSQLHHHLTFAENYISDGRLDDADLEVQAAEMRDKNSTDILLLRAKLLQARKHYPEALDALDKYDRIAASSEIEAGEKARTDLLYQMKKSEDNLTAQLTAAELNGNFVQAFSAAQSGLQIDPANAAFLYGAGIAAAVLRKDTEARALFQQYLKASRANSAETEHRAQVYSLLPAIRPSLEKAAGSQSRNWFSGARVPQGIFYCPLSLMPNARPGEVHGSHKQSSIFTWKGEQLVKVNTVTAESPDASNVTVYFDYFPDGSAVRRVGSEPLDPVKAADGEIALTPDGAVGPGKGAYTALFNGPGGNPCLAEKLTGKPAATLIAGNPYFHPFVWDGVHVFLASCGAGGHVQSAKEIRTREEHNLEFEWSGDRLMSITDRASGYRRQMQYDSDRIVSETIHFRDKNSRIEYKYRGDQLVEANCDTDTSLGNRSRRVVFND